MFKTSHTQTEIQQYARIVLVKDIQYAQIAKGLITRDNANYSDGEAYCDDCICDQRSENIEAYNYRPDRLNFLKSENEDPKEQARLFLGFEIEAGSLDSNSEAGEVAEILTEKF